MIALPFYHDLPVAVLGLGASGMVAARALSASGARVLAWDDNPARRAAAEAEGIATADLTRCDWRDVVSLVLSPGIPHSHPEPHPVAATARAAGCEIIGDIELLGRAQRNAFYIGVTGTNGKSTTTALIGHLLGHAGREVAVGGNLGTPALALAAEESGGAYVLEMSSYQLELTRSITFDVAVLLNVSADHLERHGGLEGYVAAKRLIFHRQTRPRSAVIGLDDEICRGIHRDLVAADDQEVIAISGNGSVSGGVYAKDGTLYDATGDEPVPVIDLGEVPSLPGSHNAQNAAAAYAAAKAYGLAPPIITACLRSFPGLPHRQERIARIDGVLFVNDSKATNADAAAKALASYGTIYWIAGGQAKEGGIDALEPLSPAIVAVFLIGEAEDLFARQLKDRVAVSRCGTLAKAVEAAFDRARGDGRPEPVVLLSPAAASFDQFDNFEARGEAFRSLVAALPGEREILDHLPANGAAAGRFHQ